MAQSSSIPPGRGLSRAVAEAKAFARRESAYLAYMEPVRQALADQICARLDAGADQPELEGLRDPLLAQLRAIQARFKDLDAITRALLLLPEAPGNREVVARELGQAALALLGLELEARAAQSRIAVSAALAQFQGDPRPALRKMSLTVDARFTGRLRALAQSIRGVRERDYRRTDSVTTEDILGWLLALGEANPTLIAALGAPDATAIPFLYQPAKEHP